MFFFYNLKCAYNNSNLLLLWNSLCLNLLFKTLNRFMIVYSIIYRFGFYSMYCFS